MILFLLVLGVGSAWAFQAKDVVNDLQSSYESIQTVQGTFQQTYRSKRFGNKNASGNVRISKPGKMRWDYDQPKKKMILMDGKHITLFDPEDRQVLRGKQPKDEELPVALSFLWGKGKLTELFKVSIASENKDEVVLKCVPKEPIPNTAEVLLTLSLGERVLVKASRIMDGFGGENEIRFLNMKVNEPLSGDAFVFTPPENMPVVGLDMSELKF